MIVFAIFVLSLSISAALVFAKLKSKLAAPDRIRMFDRWTWSLAVLAALASVLLAWPVDFDAMDSLWRPAAAVFNASAVWSMVLLVATGIRSGFFHQQRP